MTNYGNTKKKIQIFSVGLLFVFAYSKDIFAENTPRVVIKIVLDFWENLRLIVLLLREE